MRLRPLSITLCLVLAATLASVASVRADDPFTPGCTLPFASIAKTHPLDGSCPIEGEGSAKSKLQNRAKNNFCAAGVPTILTYQKSAATCATCCSNGGTSTLSAACSSSAVLSAGDGSMSPRAASLAEWT